MKTKSILLISFIASTSLAYAQFGALNKAKNLVGNSSNNSSTNNNNSTNSTTPSTNSNTAPASTNNTAPGNSNSSTSGNAAKQGNNSQTAAATIYFLNSTGQKTSDYKDGDAISAHIDFTGAMKDVGGKKYNDVFVINLFDGTKYLNGKKLSFLKDEDLAKTFFEFQVACSTDDAKSPLAEAFTKTLAQQLGKGAHTITVKMIRLDAFNNEFAVGEGTLNLDLTNGEDKLTELADSYDAKEIAARRMPPAVMRNASIEKDLMNIVQYDFEEKIVPLRAVIDDSDWEILRDDYNVITGRTIAGYVAFKVPRNGRCFYERLTIYQPYAGGGKYGLSKYYDTRHGSDHLEIKFENVMK